MGRPRKAEIGDVVYWGEWHPVHEASLWQVNAEDERAPATKLGLPAIRIVQHGIVVGYEQRANPGKAGIVGFYKCVRITHPVGGRTFGYTVWKRSDEITKRDVQSYRRTAQTVRANERLGYDDRGCSCQCCAHFAIPRSAIREDGTLKGES